MESNSKLGKYTLIRTLGQGAFSKVKLALNKEDGKYYAIKLHDASKPSFFRSEYKTVLNEIEAIQKLNHPNIIKIHEVYDKDVVVKKNGDKKEVHLVVVEEIAAGGELFYYVSHSGYFTEKYARYYFH